MIQIPVTAAHLEPFKFELLGVQSRSTPSPKGVWIGAIDGWALTAPCGSPVDALEEVRHIFLSGHYRRHVLAMIRVLHGLTPADADDYPRAQTLMADATDRLSKVDAWLYSMALSHGL